MKPDEFISFDDRMPLENKYIVVTNNINGVDAYGEMSDVWLANVIIVSEDDVDGIVTFDAAGSRITRLTHYKYV